VIQRQRAATFGQRRAMTLGYQLFFPAEHSGMISSVKLFRVLIYQFLCNCLCIKQFYCQGRPFRHSNRSAIEFSNA